MKLTATILLLGLIWLAPERGHSQSLDDSRGGAIEIPDSGSSSGNAGRRSFQPRVGRKAAEKYMAPNRRMAADDSNDVVEVPSRTSPSQSSSSGDDSHYMAIHVGSFVSDSTYKWGDRDQQSDTGRLNVGVTYRVGEWVNSMDMNIRVDYAGFELSEGRANKLSFLPVIMFPDANSRFPLYFGIGAGLGVFVNQISNESPLSIDYQVLAGVRFMDVFEGAGFFLEAGMKNHFLLLSDGQFNGTFVTAGTVFTF